MFRALIRVEAQAKLLDAPQSLELRSVDQTHHQLAFARVSAQANDVMDRIAIDSFRHLGGFLIPAKAPKGNEAATTPQKCQNCAYPQRQLGRGCDLWIVPNILDFLDHAALTRVCLNHS